MREMHTVAILHEPILYYTFQPDFQQRRSHLAFRASHCCRLGMSAVLQRHLERPDQYDWG